MSLVKFIKQNKATMLAINTMLAEDFPTGSENWWDVRISVLVDWFESNPLSIGIPSDGSLEMMRNEIERGNKYPKSRLKCWRHILLELNEIPDFEKHVQDELQLALDHCGGKDNDKLDDLLSSEKLKHMATTMKTIQKEKEDLSIKEDGSSSARDTKNEIIKITTQEGDINMNSEVENSKLKATTPPRRNSLVSPKATSGRSTPKLQPLSPKSPNANNGKQNKTESSSNHKKNKKSATILAKAFLEHGMVDNEDVSDGNNMKAFSTNDEDKKNESQEYVSPTKSIYSEKTLLGRQQKWLEAKEDKIQTQLKEKEEAELKTLTFIPQTNHSRQRQRTNSNTSEKSNFSTFPEPSHPVPLASFKDSSISGITQTSSDGGEPYFLPPDQYDNNNSKNKNANTNSYSSTNNSTTGRRRSYLDTKDQMKGVTQTSIRRRTIQDMEKNSIQDSNALATSSRRRASNNFSPTKQSFRRSSVSGNDTRDPSPTKRSSAKHRRNSSSLDSTTSATSTDYKIATKGKLDKQKSRSLNDSDFSSFVETETKEEDFIQPVAPAQIEEQDIQSLYAKTISKMNEGINLSPSPKNSLNGTSIKNEEPQSQENKGTNSKEEENKKEEIEEDDGRADILPEAKVKVYKEGSFFSSIVNGRGYLRVRQGGEFQMRSMYRKKDKHHRQQGVSLLVGRLESPPHDEKVITVMFDTDIFTEEEAFNWWQLNSRRLAGGKPKLNKDDIVNNIKRKLQLAA